VDAGEISAAYVPLTEPQTEPEQEALEVLLQLGFNRPDALRSLRQAATAHPEVDTSDELVRLVFQNR
jgi:Holliday junction resolvasome RuvABC DNA-binding subunit